MKILIIGLGSIGKKHVVTLKSILKKVDIIALRSSKNAKKIPGISNVYSYKEIENILIDFAIVSNPTSNHLETINNLIKFKVPLFIEKPLNSSLDIEDLIDVINSKKIYTYVACNLRFLDCIRFVKEKLSQDLIDQINEVNVYCGSYLPDWRPNIDFRQTYSTNLKLGGGVHLDLIHELDYIYWFFGVPKEVFRRFKNQSSLKISTYDYANYLLDYERFSANIVLNYYRKDSKRSLELVFENETWCVDLIKNQVLKNNQVIFSSQQNILETYQLQMQYFISNLKNNVKSMNTVNNAFEVLKICIEK